MGTLIIVGLISLGMLGLVIAALQRDLARKTAQFSNRT